MLEIARSVRAWKDAGHNVALGIVVRTWGSSPREVGSMMAVNDAADMVGSVSGGCVEGAVLSTALECMENARAELLTFSTSNEKAWEAGLPCGGDIEVYIVPFIDEVHDELIEQIEQGESFTLVMSLDSQGAFDGMQAVVGKARTIGAWVNEIMLDEVLQLHDARLDKNFGEVYELMGSRVFVCCYNPRPAIVCVGAVHIAACLTPLAKALNYDVVIIDPRSSFLTSERFPQADYLMRAWPQDAFRQLPVSGKVAVCVLSHDEKIDVPALDEALKTKAFYIGCLGHAETLLDRRNALEELGNVEEDFSRIFGPIGIYIGGRASEEIALSILAQVQSVRYGRIDYADEMPGHRMVDFTNESVAQIAASRKNRKLTDKGGSAR